MIDTRPGIWHVAGPDVLSRYDFALMIADVYGLDESLLVPAATASLDQAAPRPLLAGLRTSRLAVEFSNSLMMPTRDALIHFRDRRPVL